jgi:hypothetical protein
MDRCRWACSHLMTNWVALQRHRSELFSRLRWEALVSGHTSNTPEVHPFAEERSKPMATGEFRSGALDSPSRRRGTISSTPNHRVELVTGYLSFSYRGVASDRFIVQTAEIRVPESIPQALLRHRCCSAIAWRVENYSSSGEQSSDARVRRQHDQNALAAGSGIVPDVSPSRPLAARNTTGTDRGLPLVWNAV